jgi:hypothetical protein
MASVEDTRIRALLEESLALWQVPGTVHGAAVPVVAEIRAASGALVWVERAGTDTPFRWFVRWRLAGEAPGGVREVRPRVCGSLVGLLAAAREGLGVERGSALRVAAAP